MGDARKAEQPMKEQQEDQSTLSRWAEVARDALLGAALGGAGIVAGRAAAKAQEIGRAAAEGAALGAGVGAGVGAAAGRVGEGALIGGAVGAGAGAGRAAAQAAEKAAIGAAAAGAAAADLVPFVLLGPVGYGAAYLARKLMENVDRQTALDTYKEISGDIFAGMLLGPGALVPQLRKPVKDAHGFCFDAIRQVSKDLADHARNNPLRFIGESLVSPLLPILDSQLEKRKR